MKLPLTPKTLNAAPLKITIFGAGYVGLVTGVCFAELGYDVICVDIDHDKIEMLGAGKSPIYEKDMEVFLQKNIARGRIVFTHNAIKGIEHGDYLFIAVGTPPFQDGSVNLGYVYAAVEMIGNNLDHPTIIISKSTVPVGTCDKMREMIQKILVKRNVNIDFDLVSNPEFLKQGDAIFDFMHSDRIIIGADNEDALTKMLLLYRPFNTRIVTMDIRSAELTKYAANAFLATRISFMNEMAMLAEKLGANVESVRVGISTDPRVGPYFLHAGCGYGGSCFPKDVKALIRMAQECGSKADFFTAVENINERQKKILLNKLEKYFRGDLDGKIIALWGLAFKPNTDDMREAPSRTLLECLWQKNVKVRAYDPVAMNEAKRIYGLRSDFLLCDNAHEALNSADALLIITEWDEFRDPNFEILKNKLKNKVIFDGRNIYCPNKMRELGIEYYCIGKGC